MYRVISVLKYLVILFKYEVYFQKLYSNLLMALFVINLIWCQSFYTGKKHHISNHKNSELNQELKEMTKLTYRRSLSDFTSFIQNVLHKAYKIGLYKPTDKIPTITDFLLLTAWVIKEYHYF